MQSLSSLLFSHSIGYFGDSRSYDWINVLKTPDKKSGWLTLEQLSQNVHDTKTGGKTIKKILEKKKKRETNMISK